MSRLRGTWLAAATCGTTLLLSSSVFAQDTEATGEDLSEDAHRDQLFVVCANESGVDECQAFCRTEPDADCLDEYCPEGCCGDDCPEPEPVFGPPQFRLSVRAQGGAHFAAASGGHLGAEIFLGRRFLPGFSVVAGGSLAVGYGEDERFTMPWSAELGIEGLLYGVGSESLGLSLGLTGGVFHLPFCGGRADCPMAIPMMRARTLLLFFDDTAQPATQSFAAWSLGLTGGAGPDLHSGDWVGQAGLLFGVELSGR